MLFNKQHRKHRIILPLIILVEPKISYPLYKYIGREKEKKVTLLVSDGIVKFLVMNKKEKKKKKERS